MSTTGVIYMLTNQINGKQYIGQTIRINRRIREHKMYSYIAVEKAIDEYGWNNFTMEILEDNVAGEDLDTEEAKYIERYDTYEGTGYNCTKGGEGFSGEDHPMYGKHHSDESKQKISEAVSGKNNPNYGKQFSEKIRQNMSEGCKGRELSEETKQKMSKSTSGENNPMYGVRRTGEKSPNGKILQEEGRQIKEEYQRNKDATIDDVAKKHDISHAVVDRIVNGRHWTTRNLEEFSDE